jgi:hypothetical protein
VQNNKYAHEGKKEKGRKTMQKKSEFLRLIRRAAQLVSEKEYVKSEQAAIYDEIVKIGIMPAEMNKTVLGSLINATEKVYLCIRAGTHWDVVPVTMYDEKAWEEYCHLLAETKKEAVA